jgi:two-component system, NarL family, response regulator YdfI
VNPTTRILIADDHLVVREGLRLIFETTADLQVIAEASNGRELLALLQTAQPDVVVLDIRMPEMDGLEALAELRETYPHLAVLVLTTYDEDEFVARALHIGAKGYLLKDTDRVTLIQTVRDVASGKMSVTAEHLARAFSYHEAPVVDKGMLTVREIEVLARIAIGQRSKEIAHDLLISERTVKAHIEHIFIKLQVDSRAAAVAIATQRNWI